MNSRFKVNDEQHQAIEDLDMEHVIEYDTMRMRFCMRGIVPEFSVPIETWEERPTWVIGAASRFLAMAAGNERLREMMEHPVMLCTPPGPEYIMSKNPVHPFRDDPNIGESDPPAAEQSDPPAIELPVKGKVHIEPNQQPDGTIGDTGRFL